MTIPTVPPYAGQLPDDSDPVTFSDRAEAVFDWLVTGAAPAISSVASEMNAALAGDPGSVVEAVGDIQDRLGPGYLPGAPVYLQSGSGNWAVPAGLKALEIRVFGAGGAAGGVDGSGGTDDATSGGGGGGGYCRHFHQHVPGQSYSYQVGAGGVSAAGNAAGTDGGASSFASSGSLALSAGGGRGGSGDAGKNTGQANGGAGGMASGGTLNLTGQAGGMGKVNAGNPVPTGHGGAPGAEFPGTEIRFMNQDGADATSPGAGGAGAIANSVSDDYRGGHGAPGLIIIQPYF
ncbi:glycine-rich domain-containing protein [Mangrovicoccus algicola]|uniref:Glycine-rich domain-containing protein n=1 Tax=Mangrovicoccus algicola TaxID=2771008 RepID=A0A8J6Z6Q3_9RHOB|nr:hypothetical protein [Mangrovicoccus algicola]MBE3637460.1 hypothetical protein [Mangrovicoccus algicola]